MTQALLAVVLFMAGMAALPWLIRRLQQRQANAGAGQAMASKVVSAVAVGPQQRVVTVEVGPEHARTWLVLGVTAQQIHCLHVLPAAGASATAGSTAADFARTLHAESAALGAPALPSDVRHGS